MVSQKVRIMNPSGLHLKNALYLSNSVSEFQASVQFEYDKDGVHGIANLKSILSIVAAGVRQGEEIEICCEGPDEKEALASAVQAISSGLGEEPGA